MEFFSNLPGQWLAKKLAALMMLEHETKVQYNSFDKRLIIARHDSSPFPVIPVSDSWSQESLKSGSKVYPLPSRDCDSIWLLDDDAPMLKALGRLLNSAGFRVEKFNDSATFLAKLEQVNCRVAVLDVWMPDMNGLEVQSCLRRDSPQTRIIFITGRDDPSVRQAALDAGAFGFLTKPFQDEALLQLVQEAACT